ncbi:MAG TPA: vWA domain-containing protein [Polyangia bacterium]|nr:vWA domain-containing protein [Polyangia bacterium]
MSVALLGAGCAGTKTPGGLGQGGHSGPGGQAGTTAVTGSGGAGGQVGTGAAGSSAAGTFGTTGGGGAGGTTRICGLQQFAPTPKNADILLVLDRSASMQDPPDSSTTASKWSIVVPTLDAVIASTDTSVLWGMKSFPEGSGSACVAGSVTNAIDVGIAAGNAAAVTGTINATTPAGNGTPTGDAINAAVTYLKSLSDSNPKYVVLATDGEPSCAAIPSSENTSGAKTYAVTEITNAKAAGFPTFVIGIATSDTSDTATLNAMADAGGEVPASASNPLAPHFYLANNTATLTAALDSITGQISSCLFPLATPPPVPNDPTKLGVYLGSAMTKIPNDPTMADGWAYTDTNDTAVEVFGSWCTMIQAAGAGAVQIVYGCASINVP